MKPSGYLPLIDQRSARYSNHELESLVDLKNGTIDRRIFWDEGIYALELERIFARCWLFVCHESQIPARGDFITTQMGQDAVIASRAEDGAVHVMLNSCPHRGNRVCFADEGNTRQFVCNYHGWSFGHNGNLLGMPEEGVYKACEDFDKTKWGLHKARVSSYKGLVFATFDPEAPSLDDFLGDFRWYLDILLDNDEGGTEFIGGALSSTIRTNWKFPAENFAGDAYHAGWTHNSGGQAMLGSSITLPPETYQANMNGHAWEFGLDTVGNAASFGDRTAVRYLRSHQAETEKRLGELRSRMVGAVSSANIFPNFSFLPGHQTFRVWIPNGPHSCRVTVWTLVNKSAPDEVKEAYRKGVMMTFSPSGVFECDDGENWENATHSNAGFVTRQQKLNYGLGLNSGIEHEELKGTLHRNAINDANQRAFYARWLELMKSPQDASLKELA
ncbi:MAG: aromatic ring-hydroxylating dioxygenase subunit alpha [Pseudomonadota bacterium]